MYQQKWELKMRPLISGRHGLGYDGQKILCMAQFTSPNGCSVTGFYFGIAGG
jgi:hypothetical protein